MQNSYFTFEQYIKPFATKMTRFKLLPVSKVTKLLSGLSGSEATGLDKISEKILKATASVISPSLTHIFNNAIVSCCFPLEWKVARVLPLHKKGPRNQPENYRPISIFPAIIKVMERILFDQIYDYLLVNYVIMPLIQVNDVSMEAK